MPDQSKSDSSKKVVKSTAAKTSKAKPAAVKKTTKSTPAKSKTAATQSTAAQSTATKKAATKKAADSSKATAPAAKKPVTAITNTSSAKTSEAKITEASPTTNEAKETVIATGSVAQAAKVAAPAAHPTAPTTHQAPDFDLKEMLEIGAHFGHQKSKWDPRMAPFIYMEKGGVHIFDLVKTAEQLKLAYTKAYQLGKAGKVLVVVGTKRQAKDVVEKSSIEAGAMYISSRWLGGFLTNWPQVQKSLKRMIKIEQGLTNGEFDNYTKYERVQLEKEQNRLERFFVGVKDLQSKPDALFVIDTNKEDIPIKEAKSMGVFTIGLVDSNANPDDVDIAIPANDDGRKSVEYFVKAVVGGYAAGKADQGKK